ncbi:hypothetical protein SAMN04488522_103728 [Pedobacter caeni]|uniref:Uncharacterized protein n=1 Tax=Pedobacter caeni TaxID=288992 RepID=A0A1M5EPG4_9SPHI|nr:hypothetical protein SAMN04488522_103728 [Pedobacter caeni]
MFYVGNLLLKNTKNKDRPANKNQSVTFIKPCLNATFLKSTFELPDCIKTLPYYE